MEGVLNIVRDNKGSSVYSVSYFSIIRSNVLRKAYGTHRAIYTQGEILQGGYAVNFLGQALQ